MVGKKAYLKKESNCRHGQGMWWTDGWTFHLKCRHCKKLLSMPIPVVLRRARGYAAAEIKKDPILQTA